MDKPVFAVIIPVYNRQAEAAELLDSLLAQTRRDLFETIIVEDGSTEPCLPQVEAAQAKGLDVKYFHKVNEGRSIARNFGIKHSAAPWLVFFDSDCVIPPAYFQTVYDALQAHPSVDCFGGPDAANSNFSDLQKAINYAMTSFLTTGGIRGGKAIDPDKFIPRTFNMGFRREVYDKVGGFREMFSEDIDMSTRIRQAGFRSTLLREAPVWHKRRVSLKKFWRQVHVFGMSRITLMQLYPGSLKLVHSLPAVAVVIGGMLLLAGIFCSPWWLLPLVVYALLILAGACASAKSFKVGLLAIPAAVVQIAGYGTGFLRAYIRDIILGKGRDPQREIEMRRGK